MTVYVNHTDMLDEHSTWRRYERGLRELTLLEAPKSVIRQYPAQYLWLHKRFKTQQNPEDPSPY